MMEVQLQTTQYSQCPPLGPRLHLFLIPGTRCLYSGHSPYSPRVFSLLFRLQDANCGLRSPVRAIKTSWQGGKVYLLIFDGAAQTGSLPWAPSGLLKSTWAGGSNKQAGSSAASARVGFRAGPGLLLWGGWGWYRATLRLSPHLSPTAFLLPLLDAE